MRQFSSLRVVRAAWRVLGDPRRLRKMAPVRGPLARVVYAPVSDVEAVERMRPVVRDDPGAAKLTLAEVKDMRDSRPGYVTDRAYRIMAAAISGSAPASVNPEDVAVFAREKDLGMRPLKDAFDSLAVLVPELGPLMGRIVRLVDLPPERDRDNALNGQIGDRVEKLVGPRSDHPDPLVRSQVALQVVVSYFRYLEGRPDARDPRYPVFEGRVHPRGSGHDR
jgi:hypothetical protein